MPKPWTCHGVESVWNVYNANGEVIAKCPDEKSAYEIVDRANQESFLSCPRCGALVKDEEDCYECRLGRAEYEENR